MICDIGSAPAAASAARKTRDPFNQACTTPDWVCRREGGLEAAASAVRAAARVKLNQNQFDALVSFSYNLGLGSLQNSTLLRLLNAGNFQAAADQFPRWDRAGGKEVAGLLARRNAERALFLTPV